MRLFIIGETELSSLHAQIKELKATNLEQNQEIELALMRGNKLYQEAKEANARAKRAEAECDRLKKILETTIPKLNELIEANNGMVGEIIALNRQNAALDQENARILGELSDAKSRIAELKLDSQNQLPKPFGKKPQPGFFPVSELGAPMLSHYEDPHTGKLIPYPEHR
jgi:chromosome segregation ATPase